jgi:imidazolonepropionase-like amidohydrolase
MLTTIQFWRSSMRRPAPVFLIMTLVSSAGAIAQRPPKPTITVFEVGRVIVGNGEPWIEDAVVVVENDRIRHIGRRAVVQIPRDAVRVRLRDKNLMPAFIDTETRLSANPDERAQQLRRRAEYGAVVVATDENAATAPSFQLRDEILPGVARMVITGSIPSRLGRTAVPTNEADARRAVQEYAERNINLIRIWIDDGEGAQPKLTPEVYKAIIDEAHTRGLRVMAYVRTLQHTKDLLRAGVDVLGGVPRDQMWDREAIMLLRERLQRVIVVARMWDAGVPADASWLRPTVAANELSELSARKTVSPETSAQTEMAKLNLGRLTFERVRIAMGSDTAVPWGHLREMDAMDVVMLPFEVVMAAGHNAGLALGLKDHGGIVPGNVANFLVLSGNPAMDFAAVRSIEAVYVRGVSVGESALRPAQTRK